MALHGLDRRAAAVLLAALIVGVTPAGAAAGGIADSPQHGLPAEMLADWLARDGIAEAGRVGPRAVRTVLDELGPAGAGLRRKLDDLARAAVPDGDPRLVKLYVEACRQRRSQRLKPHAERLRRVVFTKHYDLGGSHYAYTEGQSDAQNERHFQPGSALCLLEMDGPDARVRTLLADPTGVIRDPDVSYDGRRVLFAWKKSLDEDDYHLYEMTVADRRIRQITFGLGFADYEGAYLPGGDLVFNSTRCVQTVDCWWTEVSNLFTCDSRGRYLRQLCFDQAHSNFPTLTADGRVIYTRWDYSDRGQIYPQGLFQMSPDGTGQTELYGNNSWFPTTILHARAIPGTGKIVAIFTGHHSSQKGWLGILEPGRGRQENHGARLIAPVRDTPAVHVDAYGQSGHQFQYPYPLDERTFLVSFRPEKGSGVAGAQHAAGRPGQRLPTPSPPRFGIYLVTIDGRRELLASDPGISCNQPVPLAPRPVPPSRPNLVDYRKDKGTIYLHDVYRGPGLAGIERGSIRALRVVALEFRAAGIGANYNKGPAGGALASTPISIEGAWDVKRVLGTAKVHEDGSACFVVPARTPVYFQALDARGQMVQSMRSWVSLQPGETASCVGCHEHKNTAPPVTRPSRAMTAGPQALESSGPPQGFSFIRQVQPILDRHCVRCHDQDEPPPYLRVGPHPGTRRRLEAPDVAQYPGVPRLAPGQAVKPSQEALLLRSSSTRADKQPVPPGEIRPAFSLKGVQTLDAESERKWSDAYRALAHRRVCNWINVQSAPPMLPPYTAGASQSPLVRLVTSGEHYGVRLAGPDLDRLVEWIDLLVPYCGDYTEALNETKLARYAHFLEKRRRWQAQEAANLADWLRDRP